MGHIFCLLGSESLAYTGIVEQSCPVEKWAPAPACSGQVHMAGLWETIDLMNFWKRSVFCLARRKLFLRGGGETLSSCPASLKPTAVASVASRGARAKGAGGFATPHIFTKPERRKSRNAAKRNNSAFSQKALSGSLLHKMQAGGPRHTCALHTVPVTR